MSEGKMSAEELVDEARLRMLDSADATFARVSTNLADGVYRLSDVRDAVLIALLVHHIATLQRELDVFRAASLALLDEKLEVIKQMESMREALRPFAKEAERWAVMWADDFHPMIDTSDICNDCERSIESDVAAFTVGELRRAAVLVEEKLDV